MNKKTLSYISISIVILFIAYIVFDIATSGKKSAPADEEGIFTESESDQWHAADIKEFSGVKLNAVAVSASGAIVLGTGSGVLCLDRNLKETWRFNTEEGIRSVAVWGDTIFASAQDTLVLLTGSGELVETWGPYESGSIITSLAVNREFVVFADAGTKRIFILKKNGEVHSMVGQGEYRFVVPSPYFDVAINSSNEIYVAHTGEHRIEKWSTDGKLTASFGTPGTAPDSFCGCCNPAHFALLGDNFVTAEKGINRIKVLDSQGGFVEFVSTENDFKASIPLDVIAAGDTMIVAVNPADSKLYVFRRNL